MRPTHVMLGFAWFSLIGCCALPVVGSIPPHESEQGHALVHLFDEAVEALQQACDDYQHIRAVQLALLRNIPLSEALENVDSVMPSLQPIDRPLLQRRIFDPNDIVRHRSEVERAQRKVEMMIELLAKLLAEIERIEAEVVQHQVVDQVLTLEEILARDDTDAEGEVEIEERRHEREQILHTLMEAARDRDDDEQRFVDVTMFIRELAGPGAPPPVFVQDDDFERMAAIQDLENSHYVFSRRVVEHGTPAEWMFLDTWHIIGPFPNPGRAHIHRQFPPETIVDLDATYIGKDGREVAWVFHQTGSVCVVPVNAEAYGIWYAYTEIEMEEAMDLWIATGSDDRGDIWINDIPVWVSSDQLKGWRVDEGFRKVAFQPGRNRILFRVENGWHVMGFSLGIRTQE